jgi:hypothetical protein
MNRFTREQAGRQRCFCGSFDRAISRKERHDKLDHIDKIKAPSDFKLGLRLKLYREWHDREVQAVMQYCTCPVDLSDPIDLEKAGKAAQ